MTEQPDSGGKRPRDPSSDEPVHAPPERKRQRRWEDAPAVPPPQSTATVAAAPAVPDGAVGSKAAAVLAKQTELAAKLARLKQLTSGPAAVTAPAPAAAPGAAAATVAEAVAKATAAASRFGPPPTTALPGTQQRTGFSSGPVARAVPGGGGTARAPVLRVDALGREVDEAGNVVPVRPATAAPTLKVNARAVAQAQGKQAEKEKQEPVVSVQQQRENTVASGLAELLGQTALGAAGGGTRQKDARSLRFVQPGKLAAAAENARLTQRLRDALGGDDEDAKRAALRAKRQADAMARAVAYDNRVLSSVRAADGGGGGGIIGGDVGPERPVVVPVPDMEPWDVALLGGSADCVPALASVMAIAWDVGNPAPARNALRPLLRKVTQYVQHPVPVPPVGEAPPPPPQPLRLTAKEQKKLRTQRRKAREQEKQDMIRQGLLEPPPPKVKISNLMRVLGAEATADPTAIEQRVRAEMAARQQAHDDRNAARQLTPAERKEKQLRKMFGDGGDGGQVGSEETWCCVYRVERLNSRLNQLKVCLNAEENHLTGVGFKLADNFCCVVVEGGRKAVTRFDKVMTRRIDWSIVDPPPGPDDPDDPVSCAAAAAAAEAAAAEEEAAGPNKCTRVWRGLVDSAKLRRFKFELMKTAAGASAYLADKGLKHVWDLASAGVEVE